MEEADLVAELTIIEKVEEVDKKPVPYSVFSAAIQSVYKGEMNKENITIKQQGNSEWSSI